MVPLMTSSPEHGAGYLEGRALTLLLIGASLALVWVLLPFYGTILWAVIIALLFAPLYRRLLPRCAGRRNPAALLTLLVVFVVAIVPFALVTAALAREATLLFLSIQSGEIKPAAYLHRVFDALPDWAVSLLAVFDVADFETLQQRLTAALSEGTQFIATQALSLGQNTFEFVASLFVTLYLAFFMIRDSEQIRDAIGQAVPLTSAHKRELFDKFRAVVRATVKGNLFVAAIQGLLGGFAFWFLGVGSALLWGVLMAFLSLLPAVGAAIVWLPVALYFLIAGLIWQGVALTAYGVLVIGLVDNLLRPMLVGKDTRIPDYVVLVTTLGGMAVLGINGFVVGPTIAAMFIAVWHLYATTRTPTTE